MKSMRQKREAIFHIKDLIKVELSQEGNSEACGQSVSRVLDTWKLVPVWSGEFRLLKLDHLSLNLDATYHSLGVWPWQVS